MCCVQRRGNTDRIAGAECLLNEMSGGSHARSRDKKIFQQPSLSVWLEGRAGKGGGFPLTTNPAVVLNGQVSEEYPALPQRPESARLEGTPASHLQQWASEQEEEAAQTSSNMVFFFFKPLPPIYQCIGLSGASDHKFHFSLLEVKISVKSSCKFLNCKQRGT